MRTHHVVAWWLVIVGALNWGLVGLGSFIDAELNVVNLVFSGFPALESLIYVLVGLSGLWLLWDKLGKKK